MPKKNNYTHKIIFTWFGNLPTSTELQRFHYYQGKRNTSCGYSFSSHSQKHGNNAIFGSGRVVELDQTKLGSTWWNVNSLVEMGRWNRPPVNVNVSSMMVIGVVPATMPPMPKLEQKSTLRNEMYKPDNNRCFLECVYMYLLLTMWGLYICGFGC